MKSLQAAFLIFTFWMGQAFAEDNLEYHGYARVGGGISERGASQSCFQLANSPGFRPFRLGNECGGLYAELSLVNWMGKPVEDSDKPWFKAVFTLALSADLFDSWEGTDDGDLTIALREAYLVGGGLLYGGAKLWMGKRFYRRHDIHMHDLFFTGNMGGRGIGMEEYKVGDNLLSLAFVQYRADGTITILDSEVAPPLENTLDVRYAMGNTEVILVAGQHSTRESSSGRKLFKAMSGQSLTTVYNSKVGSADNKVIFQLGRGIYGPGRNDSNAYFGFGSSAVVVEADNEDKADQINESYGIRLADHYLFSSGDIDGAASILVQSDHFGDYLLGDGETADDRLIAMVGLRPSYYLSDSWKTTLDLGYVKIDNNLLVSDAGAEQLNQDLTKVTVALEAIKERGYWARPTFRLFATSAFWNKEAKGYVYGALPFAVNESSSATFGFQAEWWW